MLRSRSQFVESHLRSRNTALVSLDGFTLEGVEYVTFYSSPLQYHHVVMASLQLSVHTTVQSLEYVLPLCVCVCVLCQTARCCARTSLSFSAIKSRGAAALAEFFPDYRSLATLDLTKCGIDTEGTGNTSARVCTPCPLCLCGCAGIRTLGAGIQKQTLKSLTSLNLSWNNVGDEGAYVIARILGSLRQVRSS